MSKIDIDKFVASLIEFSPQQSMKYIKALEDQGLKYWYGEIVEIPQECEDEMIMKELIKETKGSEVRLFETVTNDEFVAWLEKQGKQKPIDKVEPKFKVGNWITNGRYNKLIVGINSDWPYYIFEDGTSQHIKYVDKKYHLWTIADAKDGDVLVYGDNPADHHVRIIMLFKSMRTFNSAFTHFHIFDDEFRINDWCDRGKTAHPATKEQRDHLFQKIHDEGYEWDAEKKDLRKIENYPILSNSAKTGKNWSDEDEENMQHCCGAIAAADYYTLEDKEEMENWLKSLKKRIEEQQ